jgi:hypothetical protein
VGNTKELGVLLKKGVIHFAGETEKVALSVEKDIMGKPAWLNLRLRQAHRTADV